VAWERIAAETVAVLRLEAGRYPHDRQLADLVGDLEFSYESLQPPGDSDQTLCIYNVEPGSATAAALRTLDSWTVPLTPARQGTLDPDVGQPLL